MAGGADIRAGRAFVELFLKNSLTKGLGQARKQLQDFGKQATAVGKTLIGIGVGAAVPFAMLTKTFMDFDDAMRAVQAVSQSTEADLGKLTKRAKDLGASTSFTAIQVANLMVELGRAGFSADQINDMTGAVLDLSRATGTDATLSAGIMAASIRQFGLAAGDATRIADALTMAANASFNSVESLGEALSYAGPVAADFNMSIEDTLAILGALGNVGIQGSNAGTAVRRLLTLGAAEAEKMKEIFGVAFTDAAGNARPLVDVLDEVNKATAHLGTAERAKKFNEAFGLLGITGASAISKNTVAVKDLQKKLYEAGGTAAATAKKMDAGLGGAFRIMMSAIEGVQIAIGEALAPTFTMIANKVEKFSTSLIKLVNENKQLAVGALAVVAGTIALGTALVAVGFAAQGAAAAIGAVLLPFSMLATLISPAGLITAGLVAGAVAWLRYSGIVDSAAGTIKTAWGGISKAVAAGDLALAGKIAFAALQTVALETFDTIRTAFKPLTDTLMGLWDVATTFFGVAVEGVKAAWATFAGFFGDETGDMGSMWADFAEGLVNVFTEAARTVTDVWQKTVTSLAKNFLDMQEYTGIDLNAEQARRRLAEVENLQGAEARKSQADEALKRYKAGGDLNEDELGLLSSDTRRKAAAGTVKPQEILADLAAAAKDAATTLENVQRDQGANLRAQANAIIDGNVGAAANDFRKKLNGLDRRAQERAQPGVEDDPFRPLNAAERARAEMDRLIKEANRVKAAAAEEKAKGGAEVDAARGGVAEAMKGGERGVSGFGSFSAAGLIASARGSKEDKVVKELRAGHKLEKDKLEVDKKILKAVSKPKMQVELAG